MERWIPRVGTLLERIMTVQQRDMPKAEPELCKVVYVNYPHRYYTARFFETGIQESYKFAELLALR